MQDQNPTMQSPNDAQTQHPAAQQAGTQQAGTQQAAMQAPHPVAQQSGMQHPVAQRSEDFTQSKNLQAIQVLAKIGRIMSKIIFICCIVGMAGCVIGAVSFNLIPDGIRVNGVTIHSMIESNADLSMGMVYVATLAGFIFCAAECAISKIAELYFKHELAAGTPFTFEGAREMLRLGICTVSISCGAVIVAAICNAIAMSQFSDMVDFQIGDFAQVGIGVAFIILSVIFRYGAELRASQQAFASR